MSGSTENLFGRLKVLEKLGSGSQGTVYLADDPVLERKVAIKVLTAADSELAATDNGGKPLEGRISGKLRHPNIVSIYDAGESRLGPYLVFEFVQGETLADILRSRGLFTIRAAVPLISQILDALTTAHKSQIVHLDLSPRNLLIDNDGVPKIMDFGLSQYVQQIPRNRQNVAGTLRYMAPEHFTGKEIGPHTDVFALGITFLELVTGKRVMDAKSFVEVRQNIIDSDVDFSDLEDLVEGAAYEKFLRGALAKRIADRYTDCGEMQAAFQAFIRDAELEDAANAETAQHSTIEYLLRRMRKKKDFPTISRTLADINRLTGEDSNASAGKLANVILRDFALTSKLLKLVNSSFYGSRSTAITSISEAVIFLGAEQVRITANSLTFFGHLKGDSSSAILKDSMTRSFLSGLIARHLAQRVGLPGAEEAFICGMFQNLGENLVIFYFRDEYDEIRNLVQNDAMDKRTASRSVLGVNYATLGKSVAGTWRLPDTLLAAISGIPGGIIHAPETRADRLRDFAVFANDLCEVALFVNPEARDTTLDKLLRRFKPSIDLDNDFCFKLLNAGIEKLHQYSSLFEINVATSDYCRAVRSWIDHYCAADRDEQLERPRDREYTCGNNHGSRDESLR